MSEVDDYDVLLFPDDVILYEFNWIYNLKCVCIYASHKLFKYWSEEYKNWKNKKCNKPRK